MHTGTGNERVEGTADSNSYWFESFGSRDGDYFSFTPCCQSSIDVVQSWNKQERKQRACWDWPPLKSSRACWVWILLTLTNGAECYTVTSPCRFGYFLSPNVLTSDWTIFEEGVLWLVNELSAGPNHWCGSRFRKQHTPPATVAVVKRTTCRISFVFNEAESILFKIDSCSCLTRFFGQMWCSGGCKRPRHRL